MADWTLTVNSEPPLHPLDVYTAKTMLLQVAQKYGDWKDGTRYTLIDTVKDRIREFRLTIFIVTGKQIGRAHV